MNIKFEVNDEEYYTVTKDTHYGFKLTHYYPTINPRTKQASVGSQSLFYPTMQQIADKVAYLNLKGSNIYEIKAAYDDVVERIKNTLVSL